LNRRALSVEKLNSKKEPHRNSESQKARRINRTKSSFEELIAKKFKFDDKYHPTDSKSLLNPDKDKYKEKHTQAHDCQINKN
jgi:hypothetical protein